MFRIFSHITLICLLQSASLLAQDTVNVVGPDGKAVGYWIHLGKEQPDKGYPAEGKMSEGRYLGGARKDGKWIIYHTDGITPRTIGQFKDGRPCGSYEKVAEDGTVRERGTFVEGKPLGDFQILAPNGVVLQQKTFNAEGREEGDIVFRFPTGQIEMTAVKKDGKYAGPTTYFYPNGDVKRIVTYNPDGTVAETQEKEMVNPPVEIFVPAPDSPPPAPDGSKGKTNGPRFEPSGYNKIYNDDKELWMDGLFKNSKLWDGKLYKFDSEGILLKIEIWKEGKYHSDGQL